VPRLVQSYRPARKFAIAWPVSLPILPGCASRPSDFDFAFATASSRSFAFE
jgi:hypothetical protein